MQFKNALVGAVIGGAIGIGVLVASYFLFGTDHNAMAIVVAILVGLGVRTLVATKGHASYARGALTALLAIAAFVGGKFLVAEIASRQAKMSVMQTATPPPAAAAADGTESDAEASSESADDAEQPASVAERPTDRVPTFGEVPRVPRINTALSTADFLWLFAAALIAYELGRGSGMAPAVPSAPADQPAA